MDPSAISNGLQWIAVSSVEKPLSSECAVLGSTLTSKILSRFLTFLSIAPGQGTYFGSLTFEPEMDFSRSLISWLAVHVGLLSLSVRRPRLRFLTRPPSLSL